MEDAVADDLAALLQPLLQALEALAFVARHLNPPDFAAVMDTVGAPDEALRAARRRLADWPDTLVGMRGPLAAASEAALAVFDGLRAAADHEQGLIGVFRALRHASRAQEALYPLATALPPVSWFFLDPAVRQDANLLARLTAPARSISVNRRRNAHRCCTRRAHLRRAANSRLGMRNAYSSTLRAGPTSRASWRICALGRRRAR